MITIGYTLVSLWVIGVITLSMYIIYCYMRKDGKRR